MSESTVVDIFIAPSQGEPMARCDSIEAVADKGLVGDRYYLGKGYYSGDKIWDANVTLIQQEAHEADGASFPRECLRRNIVTKGIQVEDLLGKDFQIGSAVFRGTKVWPPCNYVNGLHPGRGVLKHFAQRGGIGATVVQSGSFRVGDSIRIVDASSI